MNPFLKLALATAVFASFIVASFFTVSAPRAANFERNDVVSVNRLAKGDLLPSIPAGTVRLKAKAAPVVAKRPPLGCEPAFGVLASPALAQVYGRCAA
jgi:hypothetical protein